MAKDHKIKVVGNAILKTFCFFDFFFECILQSQMTVEKDQFRAFFRMVPQKLAICGKNGRFRATSYKIKIVENAILKPFYFLTFFSRCILQPQMTVENDQFRAFFRMVPQKLAICGKTGHFRAKNHFIKVVGNAILKIFYFITFYSRTHSLATNVCF